uniref:p0044F08.9 protein n=1 Tax=Oryza sativa subsp. japonica TaxID=39947 RepID=Q9AWV1_ORYSJ|nr:P0044F08.9 [Oryza sativa Japonica Group]
MALSGFRKPRNHYHDELLDPSFTFLVGVLVLYVFDIINGDAEHDTGVPILLLGHRKETIFRQPVRERRDFDSFQRRSLAMPLEAKRIPLSI